MTTKRRTAKKTETTDPSPIEVMMPSFPLPRVVKIPPALLREVIRRQVGEEHDKSFGKRLVNGVLERIKKRPERFLEGLLWWGGLGGDLYTIDKIDGRGRVDPFLSGPGAEYSVRLRSGELWRIKHKALDQMLLALLEFGPNKPMEMRDVLRNHASMEQ